MNNLYFFEINVLYGIILAEFRLKNRPYPGLLPAMDGSMYIENNNLSFLFL